MQPPRPPARVLVTGFDPFGGAAVNASWLVARTLADAPPEGARVHAVCLPCEFGTAAARLRAAIAAHDPALVLALGQAAGRCEFSVERVAINVDDARIADNAGAQPVDVPVVGGGPAAYFSTLPIKAMVAALRTAGLPAAVSQTAGTYVCNHVFYALMHALAQRPGVRGGFIHLPLLPEQAAQAHPPAPSLPLATLVDGVALALSTALATARDAPIAGGAEG